MAAPRGNSLWRLRETSGRNRIYETPEELWSACVDYFEWVEANPVIEKAIFFCQKSSRVIEYDKEHPRAMVIQGLCLHLGIAVRTWTNYEGRDDFLPITTRAREVMFEQKFTGASAGVMNASIIARELGLSDKTTITQPPPEELNDDEIEQLIEAAAARLDRIRARTERS